MPLNDRATVKMDRRVFIRYSAGWQLLQEDIDDHTNNGSPDGVNSRSQEVWGLRYIDDAMVRLLDKNVDGDCRDSGELFWQLSDAQFSTVAVIDKNAVLQERVSYTSYGVATHRWPHEVNNTGGVVIWGCSRSRSSRAKPRLGHAIRKAEAHECCHADVGGKASARVLGATLPRAWKGEL